MSNISGGEPLGIEAILRPDAGKSSIRDQQLENLRTQIQHAAVRVLGEIPDEPDELRTPDDVRQALVRIAQEDLSALNLLRAEHLERLALQLGNEDARIANLLGVVFVAHDSKEDEPS